MVDIPYNPRDDSQEPEHSYCCGTTCDNQKVAWEFEQTRQALKEADERIEDLLNQIDVLRVTNSALSTQQALYYEWYLEACASNEKLSKATNDALLKEFNEGDKPA